MSEYKNVHTSSLSEGFEDPSNKEEPLKIKIDYDLNFYEYGNEDETLVIRKLEEKLHEAFVTVRILELVKSRKLYNDELLALKRLLKL